MFGSDNRNVTRNQGARSSSSVSVAKLVRGAAGCDKSVSSAAQSQSSVTAIRLKRGGSPAGCGVAGKDTVPDPNGVLVGESDTLVGGASQPGVPDFTPPPAYESDIIWRDDDLQLVQDEDDALNLVDNI